MFDWPLYYRNSINMWNRSLTLHQWPAITNLETDDGPSQFHEMFLHPLEAKLLGWSLVGTQKRLWETERCNFPKDIFGRFNFVYIVLVKTFAGVVGMGQFSQDLINTGLTFGPTLPLTSLVVTCKRSGPVIRYQIFWHFNQSLRLFVYYAISNNDLTYMKKIQIFSEFFSLSSL